MVNKKINNYFFAIDYMKDLFVHKKYRFIDSVLVYGSVARGEIIPGLSDIDIMIFVNKNKLNEKELYQIHKLNEDAVSKFNLKIVFRVHTPHDFELRSRDLYYPFLYDLLLNSFVIYGANKEEQIYSLLKEFDIETAKEEFFSAISGIKQVFYDGYLHNNKYKMGDSLYDLFRIYALFGLSQKAPTINYTIKLKKKSKKYYRDLFLKFDFCFDFNKIFSSIREKQILFGKSYGAILVNKKDKKVILLQDKNNWWSFTKGGKKETESTFATIKREIFEETGISDVEIINGLGIITHWYYSKKGDIRKIYSEYYLAVTKEKKVIISDEHKNYNYVSFFYADKLLCAQNQRYLLERGKVGLCI